MSSLTTVEQSSVRRSLDYHLRFEVEGRTLHGLAVPFDSPTRIDNPIEGTFDEQFAFGSFKRTLTMRTPVLQFDHGTHPLLGGIPLGTFRSIKETKPGLEVRAPLFDNWLIDPVADAIRSGAITGMSIRFRPIAVTSDDSGPVELRTITEAELIELGPVIFPAYSDTHLELRHLDLDSKIDRHRLAEALLAGVRTVTPNGDAEPGIEPKAQGSPATVDDSAAKPLVDPVRHEISEGRKYIQSWNSN